jgi:hypothetical protein
MREVRERAIHFRVDDNLKLTGTNQLCVCVFFKNNFQQLFDRQFTSVLQVKIR